MTRPGLSIWRGAVREEEQPQLKGLQDRLKVYRQMRRDSTVGALLDAIKGAVLSAPFSVEPAGNLPVDQQAADFIADTLGLREAGDLDVTWEEHVADMLECVDFGFALAEVTLRQRADGLLGLADLSPIGQETLDRRAPWQFNDLDDVVAIRQDPPGKGGYPITVPAWKLLHFTFRGRKRNPEGESLLANLWVDWRRRTLFEELEGIGVERDVGGMPVLYHPAGLTDQEISDLDSQMERMRNDETSYARFPGPKASGEDEGYLLEAYQGSGKAYDIGAIIDRVDTRILMRFFAQWLKLGTGNVGSFALEQGQEDFFSLTIQGAVQRPMQRVWNGTLIPFLMRMNGSRFTGASGNPRLTWAKPGRRNLQGLVDIYNRAKGLLTLTEEDEDFLRDAADLPERKDGVGVGIRTPAQPVPLPGPFPSQFPFRGRQALQSVSQDTVAAGQTHRGSGRLDQLTNAYQLDLVFGYDEWTEGVVDDLLRAREQGASPEVQRAVLEGSMTNLRAKMVDQAESAYSKAASNALKNPRLTQYRTAPQVSAAVDGWKDVNRLFVDESFLPRMRETLGKELFEKGDLTPEQVREAFAKQRYQPAAYAGTLWTAQQDVQRMALAQLPEGEGPRIRWELDPAAEHCSDGPGTLGCLTLAGDYTDIRQVPTVPGDKTTCISRCKCRLLADFGNGWEELA